MAFLRSVGKEMKDKSKRLTLGRLQYILGAVCQFFQSRTALVSKLLYGFAFVFVLMNVVAYFHAYKFTHFSQSDSAKTKDPARLSGFDKIKIVLFGIDNPRPRSQTTPKQPFTTVRIQSAQTALECWHITVAKPKGTVILFHGYSAEKSQMLERSDELLQMGYNTLLVDFMGCGGSEGNETTIGFHEAENVKACFNHLKQQGEEHIFLFGSSLGAAAVIKAVSEGDISPAGIIVECPFGSMYDAVRMRFAAMNLPAFPMAGLLVFWGGVQHGFWGFAHKPTEYAKSVRTPTFLLWGGKDDKVSREEIGTIFHNLSSPKRLVIYPLAGHTGYLAGYREQWKSDIRGFMERGLPAE